MHPKRILLHSFFCLSWVSSLSAAEPVRFIPVTQENTSVVHSENLSNPAEPFNQVHRLPTGGNTWHWWGPILAFRSQGNANAPMLITRVAGLSPRATYQVGCIFLLDMEPDSVTKTPSWGIRAGISQAGIEGFATRSRIPLPDLIGLDHSGKRIRPWKHAEAVKMVSQIKSAPPGMKPYVASLGNYRTDSTGSLVAYVDDVASGLAGMASAYAGLWIQQAKDGVETDVGSGKGATMMLAARTGDWETVRREIDAGADFNLPDSEGLTILFYACLAEDMPLLKELLGKGANPDPKGQSLDPLWAAAKLGNPELVIMLLNAGARIETGCLTKRSPLFSETLKPYWEQTKVNPVSAAIRSGCVDTLEAILEHQPDLDLEKSMYGDTYVFGTASHNPKQADRRDLVSDAVLHGNSAMAAYLISRGLRIDALESPRLASAVKDSTSSRTGAQTLMLAAVLHQPPMIGVIEALYKRGVPLVRDIPLKYDPLLEPWDALSAAAWEGHPELVGKWLPLANGASSKYKARLAELADVTPCRESGELVRKFFPDARMAIPVGWKAPTLDTKTSLVIDADQLTPRRSLPKHVARRNGRNLTIAVLGSKEASGPADMLSVQASADAAWNVVDRREIAKTLSEQAIRNTNSFDSAMLNEIGDRLSADIIVLTSRIGNGEDALICFEAHSVATGLPFYRTYTPAKSYKPETHSLEFLKEIRERNISVDGGNPPVAITFLGVLPAAGLAEGLSLQGILNSGLLQTIDMTDGMIAMTREQITPLVEEQALATKGGLWGAMWTLEGGVRPLVNGRRIVLDLRLRALDREETFDVAVEGVPEDPRQLVQQAWAKLMIHMKRQGPLPDPDGSRAKREAERLLREAQYLASGGTPWEAKPYAEAALFLGANRLESLIIRKNAHAAPWLFKNRLLLRRDGWTRGACGLVGSPHVQDYDASQLDEALEVLLLTSETLEQVLALPESRNAKKPDGFLDGFWQDIGHLVEYRSRLAVRRLNDQQSMVLRDFDKNLGELVLKILPQTTRMQIRGQRFARLLQASGNFRTIPWLGKMLAEDIWHHAALHTNEEDRLMAFFGGEPDLFVDMRDLPFRPTRLDWMASTLEQAMQTDMPFYRNLLKETGFLRAGGKERVQAAQETLKSWLGRMESSSPRPIPLLPRESVSYWLPAIGPHKSSVPNPINPLIPAMRYAPDVALRPQAYLDGYRDFVDVTASGERARSQIERKLTKDTELCIKKLTVGSSPHSSYQVVENAVSEKHRLIGLKSFEDLLRSIRAAKPSNKPVDSPGRNSPAKTEIAAGISGSILADLRGITPAGHPLISFARVDPKHRHLLWVALHILPEPELALHGTIRDSLHPDRWIGAQHPWLVALDCRDGSVVHRINLVETALPGLGVKEKRIYKVGDFLSPGIAFNDSQLMVLLRWERPRGHELLRYRDHLVTVDRSTGKAAVTPPLRKVVDYQLREHSGQSWPAVIGLGDDFYVLEETEHDGHSRSKNALRHRALWRFSKNGTATRLTEPGRRPASTPFDSDDRNPNLLRLDGKRVLLASSWKDFAHYDPHTGKWTEPDARSEAQWKSHVDQIDRREHHSWQFPSFAVQVDDKTKCFTVDPDNLEPGSLVFSKPPGQLHVPVVLSPAKDFDYTFIISSDFDESISTGDTAALGKVSASGLMQSPMVRPIVINQTETQLIVGLRISVNSSHLPYHEPVMLPFLWRIDRDKLITRIKSIGN